ncbi:ABC transporter ATP-binding protein [Laceyella putida]|jgi:iron complex transport system ATP-binding protein|uniref:ABC transporter ATP-binding protein n=1 Tax=Laceyella putida TaxID=110101 RepID=A0ABW2RP44_9BACL
MVIELSHVSWKREEQWILQDVSWRVKAGEHWCLVGLNGSGKTTLLRLVNGYIWPTSGSVRVLGRLFGETDVRALRKEIGWVSSSLLQQLHGHETAERIVLSGKYASIGLYDQPTPAEWEKARSLLEMFGCGNLIQRKYDTLSQGERQRVLIARALMADPALLILDEPCVGLDLLAREQVLRMIEGIATQPDAPTLIYVTHYIEEVMPCFSKTLLLKQGCVHTQGQTSEVLTSSGLSRFFGVPLEVSRRQGRYWLDHMSLEPFATGNGMGEKR